MKWPTKHPILFLTLVCLGVFFVNLDAIFVNIMEARNFITAREMIQYGHWLLTTINGEPRYQKPPLPTWLTAFSALIFGLKSLWALRLPAAFMGLLTVLFTYKLAAKVTSQKPYALLSALIAATSFYIIFAGRNGQWDVFTHAFMMGCLYQLWQFFTHPEKKYQHAFWAALFFGASFMSKGPVSLYALMLPFLLSYGWVYRFKGMKSRWLPLLLFLVVATLVSGWWFWYTYTFDTAAVTKITQKEATNWAGYNTRPFYYYWSFFTQSGLWTLPAFVGLLYPYLKNRVVDKKGYRFTFWWTILSVVLLSLIPEKKSRYLLPVLIPLAMNTAYYVDYLFRSFKTLKNPWEKLPVYLHFGLLALVGLAFPLGGYLYLQDRLDGHWLWYVLLSISLFVIGAYLLRSLLRKDLPKAFYGSIVFILAVLCFGLPISSALTINPEYKSTALLNDWQAETQRSVYELGSFTPEMVWAYGKPIPVLSENGQVEYPKEDRFGLLVSEEHQQRLQRQFKEYHIQKITRYDMNPKASGERSHRPRLWRDFYLLERNK